MMEAVFASIRGRKDVVSNIKNGAVSVCLLSLGGIFHFPCSNCSFNTRFRTLPVALRGSSSLK